MLDLNINLEEDEEDVNIDIDISEDDVDINIKIVEDQLTDLFVKMNHNVNVINTVTSIANNFSKFGITKETLHLVNTNNQLSSLFNVTFPSYEEDDMGEIDKATLPTMDVFMEGANETIENILEILSVIVREIIDQYAKYFRFYKVKAIYLKVKFKRFHDFLQKINEASIDHSKFSETTITGCYYDEWKTILNSFNDEWGKLIKLPIVNGVSNHFYKNPREFVKPLGDLNSALVQFDHMLQITDKDIKIVRLPQPSPDKMSFDEKETIDELGFNLRNIKEGVDLSMKALSNVWNDDKLRSILRQMELINSNLYRAREEIKKRTNGNLNLFHGWSEEAFKTSQASLRVYNSAITLISKGMLILVSKFHRISLTAVNALPEMTPEVRANILQIEHKTH